mmetsp:Transcript_27769/g.54673  ORF Transcript_27769/g.54673 Transcript_27769/m.54673 type:complete len:421 (+) Transcript_27769:15-1277(+)
MAIRWGLGIFLALLSEGTVVELTEASFRTNILNDPQSSSWFVEFYAPWCDHCMKFTPTWELFATTAKEAGSPVVVAKLNGNDHKGLVKELGLTAFPTLLLFKAGNTDPPIKYTGIRTSEGLVEFLKNNNCYAAPRITLRYFNTRGRAEVIRLVLEAAFLQYEQVHYDSLTWPDAKVAGIENGMFLFGQVPSVSYNDRDLVQTWSIVRYLGSRHNLLPAQFFTEIDMLLGGLEDILARYGRLVYSKNFHEERAEYEAQVLPAWLAHYNRYLSNNRRQEQNGTSSSSSSSSNSSSNSSLYLVGGVLTVADIGLFSVIQQHLPVSPSCLAPFPLLSAHFRLISEQKGISNYLASDRRPQYQNGVRAFFDSQQYPADSFTTTRRRRVLFTVQDVHIYGVVMALPCVLYLLLISNRSSKKRTGRK